MSERGPVDDMWRVDVAGYPVSVRGELAKDHLEQVNRRLARMKMALHRINQMHPTLLGAGNVAREALRHE